MIKDLYDQCEAGMTYYWLHIPTGISGQREIEHIDRCALLTLLDRWNAQQAGTWLYTLSQPTVRTEDYWLRVICHNRIVWGG